MAVFQTPLIFDIILKRVYKQQKKTKASFHIVLIYFSFTVKAATLIFISGRSSAISGKSGSIYNLVKELISFLGLTSMSAFHEKPYRTYTH